MNLEQGTSENPWKGSSLNLGKPAKKKKYL